MLKRLVCNAVTLPRLIPSDIHSLSKEEARRLLEVAKEGYLHCLLTLALATGMRLGELLALRWEEVDLENKTLQVRHTVDYIQGYGKVESEPKTTSGRRSITLPQFAIEELERHRTYQEGSAQGGRRSLERAGTGHNKQDWEPSQP